MPPTNLWIPETAKELLAVELQDSTNATDAEWQAMVSINEAIVDWLNGKLDSGTLYDILLQYNIRPEMLDESEEYLTTLIKSL